MTSWNLFIDDERDPPNDGRKWVVARNMLEFQLKAIEHGSMPSFISFDHDLGENQPTGYDIAKFIVECDLAGDATLPKDFDYYVHSQNPIGKANIEGYIDGYLKAKERSEQVPFNQHRFDEMVAIAEQDYDD